MLQDAASSDLRAPADQLGAAQHPGDSSTEDSEQQSGTKRQCNNPLTNVSITEAQPAVQQHSIDASQLRELQGKTLQQHGQGQQQLLVLKSRLAAGQNAGCLDVTWPDAEVV